LDKRIPFFALYYNYAPNVATITALMV